MVGQERGMPVTVLCLSVQGQVRGANDCVSVSLIDRIETSHIEQTRLILKIKEKNAFATLRWGKS